MNYWVTYLAKSLYAALVAVSSGVIIALRNDDGAGAPVISGYEWLVIVLAGLVAGVGVFALPPAADSPSVARAKAQAAALKPAPPPPDKPTIVPPPPPTEP